MKSKRTKVAAFAVLILLVGAIIAAVAFIYRNKASSPQNSFQKLKRNDIEEMAFNTADDFYYILNEEETDALYKELQKLEWKDSGTDDVPLQNGVKIRLTLNNGEDISFQGSGHTLVMEDKAYYIEGNALEDIEKLCSIWWNAVQRDNENRTDFSDIKEETVHNVKVYEGVSLCYTLSKEEKNEIITFLNAMKFEKGEDTAAENPKRRYYIEKENGIVLEFSVDKTVLSMNGKAFSISEKDGIALQEKQEKWLQEEREKTRQMPFESFNADKVKSIALTDSSGPAARELTEEEKKELLDLLCRITIAGTGTKDYIGRAGLITEAFLIEKEDGTKITISASQDPFVMDKKGYVIEDEQMAGKLSEIYQRLVDQGQ